MKKIILGILLLFLLVNPVFGKDYALVVSGIAGEKKYSDLLTQSSQKMVEVLKEIYEYPENRLCWLAEESPRRNYKATKSNVLQQLKQFAKKTTSEDSLFIFLFGHGQNRNGRTYFCLPDEDIADFELAEAISEVKGRIVILGSFSYSGGIIPELSGENRIIITSCQEQEGYWCRFSEFFPLAFEEFFSDLNKDGRISLAEAFTWTANKVESTYQEKKYYPTEHALLEADGDGIGQPAVKIENIEGEQAPDFTMLSLDNQRITLSDWLGQLVLLNFWSSWSAPSQTSLKNLKIILEKYPEAKIISVSLDTNFQALSDFAQSARIPYPVLFDGRGGEGEIVKLYDVATIPSLFIIGKDGKFLAKKITSSKLDEIEAALKLALQGKSSLPGPALAGLTPEEGVLAENIFLGERKSALKAKPKTGIDYLPPELKQVLLAGKTKHPQQPALFILKEEFLNVNRDMSSEYSKHVIIYIGNMKAARLGDVSLTYNPGAQIVEIGKVRTILKDGTVINLDRGKIYETTPEYLLRMGQYADIRTKHFFLPGIKEDSIIEYNYKIKTTGYLIRGEYWQRTNIQETYPILWYKWKLSVPRRSEFSHAFYNFKQNPAVKKTSTEYSKTWQFELKDLKPPEKGEKVKAVSITSLKSWDELARWWWYLSRDQTDLDEPIKQKVRELTKGAISREEKCRRIYNWVTEHIRYVGIEFGLGGYKPRPATQTFANKYGDCKDKVILLISMLKEIGVEAYPVLINSLYRVNLKSRLPCPAEINHVVAVIKKGNGYIWVDPTDSNCPYGYFPAHNQDKWALVIKGEAGEFMRTPLLPIEKNGEKFKIKSTISEDGLLKATVNDKLTGNLAVTLRKSLKGKTSEKQKEYLLNRISQSYGAKLTNFSQTGVDVLTDEVNLNFELSLPQYAQKSGNLLIFKLPDFGFNLPGLGLVETKLEGLASILPQKISAEIIVNFPPGYKLKNKPQNLDIKYPFGSFNSKFKISGKKLTVEETIILKFFGVKTIDKENLNKFLHKIHSQRQVILEK